MTCRATVQLLCVFLATSVPVLSQAMPELSFDAATIKPMDASQFSLPVAECRGVDKPESQAVSAGLPFGQAPIPRGRCIFNWMTLKDLIAVAYRVEATKRDQNILAGSSWILSERYHVEAVAPNPATVTSAQLLLMLQPLLADRFSLRLHKEMRDLPGYALVVAKSGVKLEETTVSYDKSGLAGQPGFMRANGISMSGPEGLAAALSVTLGQPVTDETGLTGRYRFSLRWTPGQADLNGVLGMLPPEERTRLAGDPNGPSIFTAVQEQLGLRLDSKKVPTEVIVIDHAEKPTAN